MNGVISPLPYPRVFMECTGIFFLFTAFAKILVTVNFLPASDFTNISGFPVTDDLQYYGNTVF